jgi:hypothetical protein
MVYHDNIKLNKSKWRGKRMDRLRELALYSLEDRDAVVDVLRVQITLDLNLYEFNELLFELRMC